MQITSNASYELIPFYAVQSGSLEEELTDSLELKNEAALWLFEDQQALLFDKIQSYDKEIWRAKLASALIVSSSVVSAVVGSAWNPAALMILFPGLFASLIPLGRSVNSKNNKEKAESVFINCDLIKVFRETFEEFKSDPQDVKLKKIFDNFEEISKQGYWSEHFDTEDLKLFQGTGKLFLMDAIATLLKEKNEYSLIAKQWEETFESVLKSKKSPPKAEPWQSIGIVNPSLEAYLDFDKQHHHLQSMQIADKITSIFKTFIETAHANNDI